MNEVLYEETALPYDYKKQKIYYIVCKVFIGIFFAIMAVFFFLLSLSPVDNYAWVFPVMVIVWTIITLVFLFFIKSKFYNCYDYIFISGDIRIIKVVNTKKRKKIVVMDSKNVTQVGRYQSETFERLRQTPNIKLIFTPTNKYQAEKPKFYIAGSAEGQRYLLVLECTEKFLVHVLQYAGKHVLEKDFK